MMNANLHFVVAIVDELNSSSERKTDQQEEEKLHDWLIFVCRWCFYTPSRASIL